MPYIDQDARDRLIAGALPDTEGELNYALTMLVLDYVKRHGASYSTYNAVIGVLQCAQYELYRRRIAEYEDGKREINGDVYHLHAPDGGDVDNE